MTAVKANLTIVADGHVVATIGEDIVAGDTTDEDVVVERPDESAAGIQGTLQLGGSQPIQSCTAYWPSVYERPVVRLLVGDDECCCFHPRVVRALRHWQRGHRR